MASWIHFQKSTKMKFCILVSFISLITLVHGQNNVFKFDVRDALKNNVKFGAADTTAEAERDTQRKTHSKSTTCGYKGCPAPKPGMLNVHLVAHTHDDVGWLVTVDQYYYQAVQYILDSVIAELQANPQRRFIYVEVAYFYRWWREQHDSLRHIVKGLVNQGRLEFILGGWCMNDEAATHYNAIIDQHTAGFKFLQDNFGDCAQPHIGWQIDPFGHSREQASLFAQFGFDGLFFGRLDFQDKATRQKQKTMEMLWEGSPNNLGDQASLLTGVLPNLYMPPEGFCFDIYCQNFIQVGDQSALLTGVNFNGYGPPGGFCFDQMCLDYIQDDDRLEDYNKNDKIKDFIKAAKDQAKSYNTNQIMMTMGSDFQFQNAHKNFKNLDKLISYVNEQQEHGSKVNVFYSTPGCYLYALNQANQTYTTKQDDFFPYAHRNHSFWTGYFTSRAALKGYARTANNFFQACKQLDTLTQLGAEYGSDLKVDVLRQALGVVQHHDGVSGTEKQAVAYDYAKRLAHGISECQDVVNYSYGKLLAKKEGVIPTQQFCPLLNVSYCPTTEGTNSFTVLIYNPIGRALSHWVRVPVASSAFTVTDAQNQPVTSQVVSLSSATMHVPDHNGSKATGDLVFHADLPALGFTTYFVTPAKGGSTDHTPHEPETAQMDIVIENQHLRMTFDSVSGLLREVTNKDESLTTAVTQDLRFYKGIQGNNSKGEFQASGAYIFRPQPGVAQTVTDRATVTVVKSGQVQEVWQVFTDWASQVIRLYDNSPYAEIEFTIGPIPVSDKVGREVISCFTTDLHTNATFYTDANGREVLKRVRDFRPTWKLNQTEPVAGNYYPVNSRIYIRDEDKGTQFTVLTDRSQGGASIRDGQLELMLHRRTMDDDSLGVGEPLNETGISGKGLVVRGRHFLLFSSVGAAGRLHRQLGEQLYMAPVLSFSPLTTDPATYINSYNTQWSGVRAALPDNVHLLTLEQWRGRTFLLRLEHFYETGEDATLSQPAKVPLKTLFSPFTVSSVTELTLGADRQLSTATRLSWRVAGRSTNGDMASFVTPVDAETLTVVLKPMQIRTFEVTIA